MSDIQLATQQSDGNNAAPGSLCFTLGVVLSWNNPVCGRGGGFAFQKQHQKSKKSLHRVKMDFFFHCVEEL